MVDGEVGVTQALDGIARSSLDAPGAEDKCEHNSSGGTDYLLDFPGYNTGLNNVDDSRALFSSQQTNKPRVQYQTHIPTTEATNLKQIKTTR